MQRRRFLCTLTQTPLWLRGLLGRLTFGTAAAGAGRTASAATGAIPAATAASQTDTPSVAFYYASDIPVDELRAFDWVVIDPDHALAQDPAMPKAFGTQTLPLAYVSVGEVDPDRPYAAQIPAAWLAGTNAAWGSRVIDQTAEAWPAFLRDHVVGPLWRAGFRAFFLDTLDSYQLIAKTDAERQRQTQALAATLKSLVAAYPGIRLMLNRGFELVDASLAPAVLAVAAESLRRGWSQADRAYVEVAAEDRTWLLARFGELRQHFGLRGIGIDYVAPADRKLARVTARQIAADGLIPWVADGQLSSLGVGQVELVPRRALLLHSCPTGDSPDLLGQSAHLYGAMPMEYHGLWPKYLYVGAPMPEQPLAGRYAAVVLYPQNDTVPAPVRKLVLRARDEGVPVLILGGTGIELLADLGATVGQGNLSGPISVTRPAGTPNGEVIPLVNALDTTPLTAGPGSTPWLVATGADGQRMEAAAITPWGGYALSSFGVFNIPGDRSTRWSVDPIAFYHAALRIGADPMPNVTTRTGRRVMFVHFDGDGWPNACDQPGSPLACEILVRDVIERYKVPTLASVIVGEVSRHGLYPKTADESQKWARRMFALPWVEVGSHTWSHPFDWVAASETHSLGKPTKELPYGNYLPLPDYTFSTASNVTGAKEYIEQKLCPPGKPCDMILWPGDCNPPDKAVAMAYEADMGNINGGGATMSRTQPTLSAVWPLGIPKGRYFQVYAACSNEEDFTHNWQGPYFGYTRVIETFKMTDSPRRVKPVGVYYHPYIVTKAAGAQSLHTVYQWALAQPLHAIYGRQYFRSVLDWQQATVARRLQGGWQLRSGEQMREWAQPRTATLPDRSASTAIAGWSEHADRRYVHATGEQAVLLPATATTAAAPRLIDANADITGWAPTADGSIAVQLSGHLAIAARFDLPQGWTAAAGGGARVTPHPDGLTVQSTQTTLDVTLRRA